MLFGRGFAPSRYRRPLLKLRLLPFARLQHLREVAGGLGNILEPQVGRREAEAQDIGIAEVADHAARDQRLRQRVGVLVPETQLAAAPRRRPRPRLVKSPGHLAREGIVCKRFTQLLSVCFIMG